MAITPWLFTGSGAGIAEAVGITTLAGLLPWAMYNSDDVSGDPYGGYDQTDENDALDLSLNIPQDISCAALDEAITALENRIKGRMADGARHGGLDAGHKTRIKILQDALARLLAAKSHCKPDECG